MRKSIRLAAATAALFFIFPMTTVQATTPLAVHIEVQTSIDESTGLSGGPFTATGPAVDAGLICPTGDATDVAPGKVAAWRSPVGRGLNILVVKQFSCADDGPTFLVKLQVRLDVAKGTDNFQWIVVDGSGAAASLRGSGTGIGVYPTVPDPPYGVLDVYDGGVHVN